MVALPRPALALAALVAIVLACSPLSPPERSSPTSAAAAQGRSRCLGSVRLALTNLQGAAANALEQMQTAYEGKPGFRAVVFDGTEAIVVVDEARLPEWRAELTPLGIAVAPSCVDSALLSAVMDAVPRMAAAGSIATVGYNGLDDSIDVGGVAAGALLAALDSRDPDIGARGREAIAAGTLRIQ